MIDGLSFAVSLRPLLCVVSPVIIAWLLREPLRQDRARTFWFS